MLSINSGLWSLLRRSWFRCCSICIWKCLFRPINVLPTRRMNSIEPETIAEILPWAAQHSQPDRIEIKELKFSINLLFKWWIGTTISTTFPIRFQFSSVSVENGFMHWWTIGRRDKRRYFPPLFHFSGVSVCVFCMLLSSDWRSEGCLFSKVKVIINEIRRIGADDASSVFDIVCTHIERSDIISQTSWKYLQRSQKHSPNNGTNTAHIRHYMHKNLSLHFTLAEIWATTMAPVTTSDKKMINLRCVISLKCVPNIVPNTATT